MDVFWSTTGSSSEGGSGEGLHAVFASSGFGTGGYVEWLLFSYGGRGGRGGLGIGFLEFFVGPPKGINIVHWRCYL